MSSCSNSPDSGYFTTTTITPIDTTLGTFQPQQFNSSSYSLLLESGETIPLATQKGDNGSTFPVLNNSQIVLFNSNPLLTEHSSNTTEATVTFNNNFAEDPNNQMILHSNLGNSENINYFSFDENNNNSGNLIEQVPMAANSVLNDISNTHPFLTSNNEPTLDYTEFNRLFEDTSSSDHLMDMINTQDSATQSFTGPSSMMGLYEDSNNVLLINPNEPINEPVYFSEIHSTVTQSSAYAMSNSILNDALTESVFDQTPMDNLLNNNSTNCYIQTQFLKN